MLKVVGWKKVNFTAKDGNAVNGFKVFCIGEEDKSGYMTGCPVDTFFISDAKADNYLPAVGQVIDLRYNKYGKVDSVDLI